MSLMPVFVETGRATEERERRYLVSSRGPSAHNGNVENHSKLETSQLHLTRARGSRCCETCYASFWPAVEGPDSNP